MTWFWWLTTRPRGQPSWERALQHDACIAWGRGWMLQGRIFWPWGHFGQLVLPAVNICKLWSMWCESCDVKMQEEEGWWEGNLGGKVGMFPSNFVEVIEAEEADKHGNIWQLIWSTFCSSVQLVRGVIKKFSAWPSSVQNKIKIVFASYSSKAQNTTCAMWL